MSLALRWRTLLLFRRKRVLARGSLLACFALGCGDGTTPEPLPATVVVQLAAERLDPGDTTRASVTAQDATGRALPVRSPTFASSNTAIARVDTSGKVTAVAEGSVVVTATVRGVSGNGPLMVSYAVATVDVTTPLATIENEDTTRVTVTVRSAKGVTISGRTVLYSTSTAAVATVSDVGLVRGVGVGTATITAAVDGKTGSTSVTVQARAVSVVASLDSLRLGTQAVAQLSAQGFDASGNALPGRTVVWTSQDVERASVSSTGLVTWRGPGRTAVLARVGSAVDTVRVSSAGDFSIAQVHLTQGVQDADGSIPLIAQGRPAAFVVLVSTALTTNASSKIVLRLTDAVGAPVFSDTETVVSPVGPSPSLTAPTAQFLVPAAQLLAGRRWQVMLDPFGEAPDDTAANDVYPRAGATSLVVSAVPALNIRFVPITLSAHGGSTPSVTNEDIPGYLRTALSSLPLGQVNAVIGTPLTTSANFGTPPSGGGQSAFWTQVLQELDAARVASADPSGHWYGVVGPPAGYTFTQFGGFGYVPIDASSSGPGTRTAVGVRTGWFSSPTQARDLVAHELAHNFGRRHSPCGGPGSPDPLYPRPDGRLGETMHDVYAWANGFASALQPVSAQTGDIMGYCFPGWSSAYTYRGVLTARGSAASAPSVVRQDVREELLVVQGVISADGKPVLDYPISLLGFRTQADAGGEYRLQGLDQSGRVLFDRAFRAATVDHADVRTFTVVLPFDATTNRVRVLRVTGPGGSASLNTSPSPTAPDVRPEGVNGITVTCGDASARVAVQDVRTGDVLGIATGPVRIAGARRRRIGVSCANGAVPRRALVQAP